MAEFGKAALPGGARKAAKTGGSFRKLGNEIANFTSRKGTKVPGGEKFGGPRHRRSFGQSPGDENRAYAGYAAGAIGGAVLGGTAAVKNKHGQQAKANSKVIMANGQKMGSNTRKLNSYEKKEFGKGRANLITDLGTAATKPIGRSRVPLALTGVTGAATGASTYSVVNSENKKGNKQAPKTIARQQGKLDLQNKKMKAYGINKARAMSDKEIRHRKKVGSAITRTTSTMGLTATGLLGAGALAAKKPGALKAIRRAPGLTKVTPEKLKGAAAATSVATGGVAGLGGYNFAAYTAAEGKKRRAPIQKNLSAFGVSHD